MYKGQLYLDCKNGVCGVNTSPKRDGEFFPLPTEPFSGRVDYKYLQKHYKDIYEYVGEFLKAEGEGSMTVKELILSAKRIYFAGYCTCGCGEKLYDLQANDGKAYPPIAENPIKQVRPKLLEEVENYDRYGEVKE